MDAPETIRKRRSVRNHTGEPVPPGARRRAGGVANNRKKTLADVIHWKHYSR